MGRPFRFLASLCVYLVAVTTAQAGLRYEKLVSESGQPFLLLSGEFTVADTIAEFVTVATAHRAQFVIFDSPGGNIYSAMQHGRMIRALYLNTIQTRNFECASACALAFLGGVARSAVPGSIGVHQHSFASDFELGRDDAVAAAQQVTADILQYLTEMGVDAGLMQFALRYDRSDMRYLSGSEMESLKVTTDSAPAVGTAMAAPDQAVPNDGGKLTQRLTKDGLEIDPGRSGGLTVGEGKSVSTPSRPPDHSAFVEQKAIFYKESTNVAQGSSQPGYVIWSVVQKSPGAGLPPEPAIVAEVVISGGDIRARMTIRRNADKSLPASHVLEILFVTPDGIEGGGIEQILRVVMKNSEQDAGNALLGTPAKIGEGLFFFALHNSNSEVAANLNLLQRRKWFDVPIIYKSGRRALLTLEKGMSGEDAFDRALNAWARE